MQTLTRFRCLMVLLLCGMNLPAQTKPQSNEPRVFLHWNMGYAQVQGPRFYVNGNRQEKSTLLRPLPGNGCRLGLLLSYRFLPRWSVETGIMLNVYAHRYGIRTVYGSGTIPLAYNSSDGNGFVYFPVNFVFHQPVSPHFRVLGKVGITPVYSIADRIYSWPDFPSASCDFYFRNHAELIPYLNTCLGFQYQGKGKTSIGVQLSALTNFSQYHPAVEGFYSTFEDNPVPRRETGTLVSSANQLFAEFVISRYLGRRHRTEPLTWSPPSS